MQTIASRSLASSPLLAHHYEGRDTARLGIDTVLADLAQLGRVEVRVGEHEDPCYGPMTNFTCILRGRNSLTVAAVSIVALDAALSCLLEALGQLAQRTLASEQDAGIDAEVRRGIAALEALLASKP